MPARDGAAYTPDATRATDATSDLSGREERARTLVRGVDARAAARDALIRTAESRDERDTGSQLPGDANRLALDVARAVSHTRHPDPGREGRPRPDDAARSRPSTTTQGADADGEEEAAGSGRQPLARDGQAHQPGPRRATGATLASDHGPRPRDRSPSFASYAPSAPTSPRHVRHHAGDARPTRQHGAPAHGADAVVDVTPTPRPSPARAMAPRPSPSPRAGRRAWRRALLAGREAASANAGAATGGAVIAPAVLATAIVALPLVVVLLGVVLGAGAVEEDRVRGARRLAQTAADEFRAGEARGDHNHKGIAYSELVRGPGGPRDDWDACFVGWCMERAGFLDADGRPAYSSAEACLAHFSADESLGDVHAPDAGPYDPAEGDIVFVPMADGTAHVGIVTSFDGTWLRTVEGDVAGGPRNRYDRDDSDGLGGYVSAKVRRRNEFGYTFVRPRYSDEAARARVAQIDQARK